MLRNLANSTKNMLITDACRIERRQIKQNQKF